MIKSENHKNILANAPDSHGQGTEEQKRYRQYLIILSREWLCHFTPDLAYQPSAQG